MKEQLSIMNTWSAALYELSSGTELCPPSPCWSPWLQPWFHSLVQFFQYICTIYSLQFSSAPVSPLLPTLMPQSRCLVLQSQMEKLFTFLSCPSARYIAPIYSYFQVKIFIVKMVVLNFTEVKRKWKTLVLYRDQTLRLPSLLTQGFLNSFPFASSFPPARQKIIISKHPSFILDRGICILLQNLPVHLQQTYKFHPVSSFCNCLTRIRTINT